MKHVHSYLLRLIVWQLLVNDLIILAAEPAYEQAYGELFRNESLKIRSRLT